MPLYEYNCAQCDMVFESLAYKGEDFTKADCPKCKTSSLKLEVPSSFGFSFVGGTGTESIDKSIGRAAETGWERMGERTRIKNKIREKEGAKMLTQVDGNYIPAATDYKEETRISTNLYDAKAQEIKKEFQKKKAEVA